MKEGAFSKAQLISVVAVISLQVQLKADPFPLTLTRGPARVELSWPTAITNSVQSQVFPEYEVQSSIDLKNWAPIGGKVKGISGLSGSLLSLWLDQQPGRVFYRVLADVHSSATNETGTGAAQVLGYDSEFSDRLAQIGQISVQDFATNAGNVVYLPQLTWDPTTAQFWTNFSSTTLHYDSVPVGYPPSLSTNIPYNYVLDTNELGLFMTNGFVVSERLGSASFGDAYYRIFNADLPVFVTADSVLHAWHRSYQSMLEELEELQMSSLLFQLLSNMASQLPAAWLQYSNGPLRDSILDADYFLTVALNLASTQQVSSASGDFEVDQQIASTLAAINNQALVLDFPIFGSYRDIDFSQFIVRGHYTDSAQLQRYFRTMMWCSRTELRLATFDPNKEDDIRQLGTAIIMNYLLKQSGQGTNWSQLEQIGRAFVGITDSLTFAELGDLLANFQIRSPADVPDLLTLTNLQTRLLTGEVGVQAIQGEYLASPYSREQLKLPRTFTVCGQKFVLDSWAFSETVFDRVFWSPDYSTNIMLGKVTHRKPSCLDAAFAVLGNNQVVPELVARMTNENGVPFRDGPHLPYQHNLLAVRDVIEKQDPAIWSNNIYTAWLGALRALSAPTTDFAYPESMRTRAWAMKTLNTQLGSWTELRHDTLLYAKPSYTASILCSYPAGFVEPQPEFWRRMRILADTATRAISRLHLVGIVQPSRGPLRQVSLETIQSNQLAFLSYFAATASTLESISQKELTQLPLSAGETSFLKNVVELVSQYSNFRSWNGWYPQLYYQNVFFFPGWSLPDCDRWDALVADVHTDAPDLLFSGDPGAVIHEGIANVNLLLIAVDNGPDRMVYAGPVLSHYEFEIPGVTRMTDEQWKANVLAGEKPPQPEWTRSYLVPGNIPIPGGNQ